MAKLELSEVLSSLRTELGAAKLAGVGQDIRFNVDNIAVELQTVVEKEGGGEAGGKIKFWVLDIDAKASGKYKKSATQTIKLSLTPTDEDNPDQEGNPGALLLNDEE